MSGRRPKWKFSPTSWNPYSPPFAARIRKTFTGGRFPASCFPTLGTDGSSPRLSWKVRDPAAVPQPHGGGCTRGRGAFFLGGQQGISLRARGLVWFLEPHIPLRSRREHLEPAIAELNLGQKPKLGGVRILLPFHCIIRSILCKSFQSFCLFFFVLSLQKQQKDFSFLLLSFNLWKTQKDFFSLFSLLCLQSSAHVHGCNCTWLYLSTFDRASDDAIMTKIDGRNVTRKAGMNSTCFYFCTYACTCDLETSL